ncbi:hypothetical protein B5P43_21900 [Bacillus sp. SRB_336]|nr:hypothetical protein B5P43_21900 [Bacillus sp. SRB_336]
MPSLQEAFVSFATYLPTYLRDVYAFSPTDTGARRLRNCPWVFCPGLLIFTDGKRRLTFVDTYQVGDAWDALGDRTRRAIVECLALGPLSVGELAAGLPVSRPAVSQHLRVLRDAGLVVDQAVANRRIYRLDPAGVAAMRDQLDTFWGRALENYKAVAEQQDGNDDE